MAENQVQIFDSTLRDGAQGQGISFSLEDKIKIVKALDEIQVDYIEAGNPGSNPKDMEFFKRLKNVELKHSKVVAFGSTRRPNIKAEDDKNIKDMCSYLNRNNVEYYIRNVEIKDKNLKNKIKEYESIMNSDSQIVFLEVNKMIMESYEESL